MSWEKELNKELKKLKKAFGKMILKSQEFQDFKKKLKKLNLDGDIALDMYIIGRHSSSIEATNVNESRGRHKKLQLNKGDRDFFKTNGIVWE
ncbi:MAG: hypothetical protein P9M06_01410 [Candidatus Saelkia tenebricola]|nr:hypothetical protein [Candidatus Saelkia tenebricola]